MGRLVFWILLFCVRFGGGWLCRGLCKMGSAGPSIVDRRGRHGGKQASERPMHPPTQGTHM